MISESRRKYHSLLEFIDDVVDELESREEINYIFKMMEKGTGADRQLKVWNESGNDFKKLVDYIIEETNTGIEYKPTIVKKSNENNSNTKQTILK